MKEEERKWKRMLARNRKSVSSSSHSGTYCRNKGVNIRGDIWNISTEKLLVPLSLELLEVGKETIQVRFQLHYILWNLFLSDGGARVETYGKRLELTRFSCSYWRWSWSWKKYFGSPDNCWNTGEFGFQTTLFCQNPARTDSLPHSEYTRQ